jgi:nucleotide-binding universal stress UspA family protein
MPGVRRMKPEALDRSGAARTGRPSDGRLRNPGGRRVHHDTERKRVMPELASSPPRGILLATDLSARCDRALDRAVLLSTQWEARVVALHVLEPAADGGLSAAALDLPSWRRPANRAQTAARQLRAATDERPEPITALVEEGDPAAVILEVAETRACDLIVTGVARDEMLGRWFVGTTVDRLAVRSPVPVLTVRGRARTGYREVLIATDFSESSRRAFDVAIEWFKGSRLTLFNAYRAPKSGFADDPREYREQFRPAVADECEAFLDAGRVPAEVRQRLDIVLEPGVPQHLLADYVVARNVDLVVVGTHGRSPILEKLLIGSVAKAIMAAVPCDVLVVRRPR